MKWNLAKIDFILGANVLKNYYDKYCQKSTEKFSLTILEGQLLTYIKFEGGKSTASEIAGKTKTSKSMISRNVERLVSRGFLKAETDKNDRRYTILSLTEEAKPVIDAYEAAADEVMAKLFKGISDSELEGINRIIQRILRNMEE